MSDSVRAAQEFTRLLDIIATLRAPDGCPWDREQSIDTLKPFVLEETYEVIEAIDRHDHAGLREELGDFVFEAVFLAQLESEAGHFTMADSLRHIADKLVRRHPHVFARAAGEASPRTAGDVKVKWEEIKARERQADPSPGASGEPQTLLSGIAPTLPALARAFHIGTRVSSVGFDWAGVGGVVEKIQEEVDELREVIEAAAIDSSRAEEEMGDLLFTLANLARKLGIEPETALRKANDKFTRRFGAMEGMVGRSGRAIRDMTIDELEQEWQRAKSEPHNA
jgi:nucleoside triphosphate diphosphatase